MHRVNI